MGDGLLEEIDLFRGQLAIERLLLFVRIRHRILSHLFELFCSLLAGFLS